MNTRRPTRTQREQEDSPPVARIYPGGVSSFIESDDIQPLERRESTNSDQPWLRPLLTQQEAADVLRISTRQVQIEIARGRLRAVRIGRRTLLRNDDLQTFIQNSSGFVRTQEHGEF